MENNLLMTFFSLFIMLLILTLFLFSMKKNKMVFFKKTSFECGIDSWSILENMFSIRFFFVGLIFLIFDVEIIILFPLYFSSKIFFLLIIVSLIYLSLFYEWLNNSLIWK